MITDSQLNTIAITFGVSMFTLIIAYGAIQVNFFEKTTSSDNSQKKADTIKEEIIEKELIE